MSTFFKAAAGGFFGRILAALFIAACIFMGLGGPDRWIAYLIDGTPTWITPQNARVAFLVLAGIIALLLIASISRSIQASRDGSVTANDIEYGLALNGLKLFADKLGKRKRNIQIGAEFKNKTHRNIRYTVDSMFVSIDGKTLTTPVLTNNGLVLRPEETDVFRYDTFKQLDLPPEAEVLVSINVSYGAPNAKAVRHLKREYRGVLRVTATSQNLTWTIAGDDFDVPI